MKQQVQTLGRVRVDRGSTDTLGRWANGIYRDCQLTWFCDPGFLYTQSTYYDRKTFEALEWQETAWPRWSAERLVGFCVSMRSAEFGAFLAQDTRHSLYFSRDGCCVPRAVDAGFEFRWFGCEEILLAMPEINNGMILEAELYREVRRQLQS